MFIVVTGRLDVRSEKVVEGNALFDYGFNKLMIAPSVGKYN